MINSPFTDLINISSEPTQDELYDTFLGTLGNVGLTHELLQKRYPDLTRVAVIRLLSSNQNKLNEAIRTFSIIEATQLKARMALILNDSISDLSPADLARNYIALHQAVTNMLSPQGPIMQNNTQINIAAELTKILPPEAREALSVLLGPDESD
jgi:hypothetical protein